MTTITYFARGPEKSRIYGARLTSGDDKTEFEVAPGRKPADLGAMVKPEFEKHRGVALFNFCYPVGGEGNGHYAMTIEEAVEFRNALKGIEGTTQVPVMVKPWSIQHADEIVTMLSSHGTVLSRRPVTAVNGEYVEIMYGKHQDQPFFDALVQDHAGKPAFIAVIDTDIEAVNIVKPWIREEFGSDIPEPGVPSDLGYRRDAFHAPSTPREAKRDLHILEAYLQ
jgi:nucleoside diphosphate kinase